ncbi:uncharacterized protein LOC134876687 isoform X2 [Eleginops maclovinus]|uniref:uncharacterized protein LOC134876687 isoform X2 n=1 Tax=Eleginops maclovinus TaxID=56733 RepID=UPI0030801956
MDENKRIQMSLFLILLLQLTAVTGLPYLFRTVRDGDEVTLPCANVMDHQDKCDGTDWLFTEPGRTAVVKLVDRGQIGKQAKAKSHRLSAAENCSLIIKKVTVEDPGQYSCRQVRLGGQQSEDAVVFLSVVTMTDHQSNDEVTLRCSVKTNGWCRHKVKWLFQGQDVDKDLKDMKISDSHYEASWTFNTSHGGYKPEFHLFTCKVTDAYTGEFSLFPFSAQSSVSLFPDLLRLIVVSVGLAALLMITVAVNIWTRTKGAL